MKFKYLLAMFLIFIFALGIVSAAEDVDQTEPLQKTAIPEETLKVQKEDTLKEPEDIEIYFHDVNTYDNEPIVHIDSHNKKLSGNLSVSNGETELLNKKISSLYDEEYYKTPCYIVKKDDLTPRLGVGTYNLSVKYFDGTNPSIIKNKSINVYPQIRIPNMITKDLSEIVSISGNITGKLTIYVDDIKYYNETINEFFKTIKWSELNLKREYKDYNIKVVYNQTGSDKPYILEKKVKSTYEFNMIQYKVEWPKTLTLTVLLPKDATGNVIYTFNGKKYNVPVSNGKAHLKISTENLIGKYTVFAEYSDAKYPNEVINRTYEVVPKIRWDDSMSIGEKEYIILTAPLGTTGTVTLYEVTTDYTFDDERPIITKKDEILTVSIKDGHASIPLKSLSPGRHKCLIEYTIGNYTSSYVLFSIMNDYNDEIMDIEVKKNSKGYSANVNHKKIKYGQSITVNFKGKPNKGKVGICIDHEYYKDMPLSKKKVSKVISKLKPGTHLIKVLYYGKGDFYSKTFIVKVIPTTKLSLQPVKVKKSAKKITLKAILKKNKQLQKGKKIKFKFNEKTYKAKTNKKGIAKVTINKSELEKLNVGQTVYYQATYSTNTVRKSAIVQE